MPRTKKQKPVATADDKLVFLRVMSYSDANGMMSSAPFAVRITPASGQFMVDLPLHLVAHYDRAYVMSDRLVDLVQEFEQINEDYSITTLHGKAAKPMLLVTLRDEIRADARHVALLDVGVMMGVIQVSVNPAAPERIYRREDGKTLTILVNTEAAKPYILLPDTPEINDRINAMRTSIFDASNVLRTLIEAPDPAAVLLSLAGPWTQKAETPGVYSTPVSAEQTNVPPGSTVIVESPVIANSTTSGGAFASDDEI